MSRNRGPCPGCGNETGLWYRVGTSGGTRTAKLTEPHSKGARCRGCTQQRVDELDASDHEKIRSTRSMSREEREYLDRQKAVFELHQRYC